MAGMLLPRETAASGPRVVLLFLLIGKFILRNKLKKQGMVGNFPSMPEESRLLAASLSPVIL